MQVKFYGTGSCSPSSKKNEKPFRSYTGWYTQLGSDSLLFDIGGGVLHKMLLDGIDIMRKPTHLFISHFHPDHCSDIISLLQGRAVYSNNVKKIPKLEVFGPEGLKKFIEQVFLGVDKWNMFKNEVDIYDLINLNEGVIEYSNENWSIKSSSIDHFDGNCYRLDVAGKSIIYSGDMAYDERISDLGHDADLAILECSYPDRASLLGKHLCPEDIGVLAKKGNFKKVILTHMYPACEGKEDGMVKVITDLSGCEVIVAEDSYQIEI